MIDVKKLITGFLILAVAGGAAALAISNIGNSIAANQTAIVATTAPIQPPTVSGNAFLPVPTPADPNAGDGAIADDPATNPALESSTEAMMSDPNNLTNILANAYLNNLALTNPGGPLTDSSGNQTLTPPDPDAVIAEFESSSSPASIQVPDWDTEADEVPIIATTSSMNAITNYGSAVDQILDQDIVQTNLQTMLNNNSDPSFEPYVYGLVQSALQDISSLPTPTSTEALQKSLIKTLVYAKNMIALGETAPVDPLKTELIMGAENTDYQTALQDLQTQIQNAQSLNLFSIASDPSGAEGQQQGNQANGSKVLADIQSLVGIQTAHAQFTVYDPINNIGIWATVAQLVQANLKNIALQIIKNSIVFIMQKTIFAAIKGSGAPAFIQQWGTTLANAFQASALNALNAQYTCVNTAPFAPQLKLTLGATYQPNKNICAVQYNSQLNNNLTGLTKFYNNFSSGGWVTFGSTLQPDNNYYGSAFFIAQTVGNTAQNSQNAAKSQAVASQGFHGSATCTDGSNPNGQQIICQDASGNQTITSNSSCPSGSTVVETIPNNGFCASGASPMVQTPGAVFNSMVGSAVNGNFSLVTSATDWEGLASGLFVSILQETLNSLAQSTISDANGLLQQAFAGGGANSITSSTIGNSTTYTVTGATSPQPITCYAQPDSVTNPDVISLNATGGEVISSTGATTPSYTWTVPAGGGITLSATTGDIVTATANATGTYQVLVDDVTDNATGTCTFAIPAD